MKTSTCKGCKKKVVSYEEPVIKVFRQVVDDGLGLKLFENWHERCYDLEHGKKKSKHLNKN